MDHQPKFQPQHPSGFYADGRAARKWVDGTLPIGYNLDGRYLQAAAKNGVFGGANVDSEMGVEFMRAFPWVDYVVHGEAEVTFPNLLRNIAREDGEQPLTGVSIRSGGQLVRGDADTPPFVDMNLSPPPDYSDYIEAVQRAGLQSKLSYALFFESSRGCWWGAKHHCTFCGLNANGMAYRKKDADRVLREILEIARTFRCLRLYATDNILPMEFFSQLLPKLAEADLDIHIFYEVKANLTREQMKTLATSGVREIQPGIESLSVEMINLTMQDLNNLWSISGSKYLPSASYKLRMVTTL